MRNIHFIYTKHSTMKRITFWLTLLFLTIFLISCQYDNEEDLYVDIETCDTINIIYSQSVKPIFAANCYSCHSVGNAPTLGSGIDLETYSELMSQVNNERLLGTINHAQGFSPMPKGESKLDDCSIDKIEAWINQGAVND